MQLLTYKDFRKYKNNFFGEYAAPVKRLRYYYGLFAIKYLPFLTDKDDIRSFENFREMLHNPPYCKNFQLGFEYYTMHSLFTHLIFLKRKCFKKS